MSSALTTLYLYRRWAGLTDLGENAQQTAVINAVSNAVSVYCNRDFGITTYREWLDGTGDNWLLLPQWPIATIYGVGSRSIAAITVSHATAKFASVSTSTTGVRLFSVDGTGTETDTELLFTGYKTITLLAAAIVSAGFAATVDSTYGSYPSNIIRPNMVGSVANGDDFDLEICDDFH